LDIIKTKYSKKYTDNFDDIFRRKDKVKEDKKETPKKLVVNYPKLEPRNE
jgi:hypothetical protein